jgi:hypothetical protein
MKSDANLSSTQRRQQWRKLRQQRTHKALHDAADEIRSTPIDASFQARLWIGTGLQIAATIIDEIAAEMLCEDIVSGEQS